MAATAVQGGVHQTAVKKVDRLVGRFQVQSCILIQCRVPHEGDINHVNEILATRFFFPGIN